MNTPTDNNSRIVISETHISEMARIRQILGDLSLEQRECILLQQDFSLREIADLLAITLDKVKEYVKDGRKRFIQRYRIHMNTSSTRRKTDNFDMLFVEPCDNWIEKLIAVHPNDLTSCEHTILYKHIELCYACREAHTAYFVMDILIRRSSNSLFTSTLPSILQQSVQDDEVSINQRKPITENLTIDMPALRKLLDECD